MKNLCSYNRIDYAFFDDHIIINKLSTFDDAMEDLENSNITISTIYAHCNEHTAAQLQRSVDSRFSNKL